MKRLCGTRRVWPRTPLHQGETMGRPINDRYLGNPDLPGTQITATVNIDGTAEPGIILRQRSNRSYRVQGNSGAEGICTLANTGTPAEGEMSVAVVPEDGDEQNPEFAMNINNRTVRTFQGNAYAWPENPNMLARTTASIQNLEGETFPAPPPAAPDPD